MITSPALLPGRFRAGYALFPHARIIYTTDVTTLEATIQTLLDTLRLDVNRWFSEPTFVALGSVGAQRVNVLLSYTEYVPTSV